MKCFVVFFKKDRFTYNLIKTFSIRTNVVGCSLFYSLVFVFVFCFGFLGFCFCFGYFFHDIKDTLLFSCKLVKYGFFFEKHTILQAPYTSNLIPVNILFIFPTDEIHREG